MGETLISLILLIFLVAGGAYAVQIIFSIGGISIWTVCAALIVIMPTILVTAAAVVVVIEKIAKMLKGDAK